MKRQIIPFLILTIIIVFGFFLRFYRLGELMNFTLDEEYESFIIKRIITKEHFPAIGVSSAVKDLYTGPLFLYLSSIFYALFKGNPLAGGLLSSGLGVLTILVMYKVASVLFNLRTGIIASLLYALSYLIVVYDRHFWVFSPISLLSLLIIYSLFKIIKGKKNYIYLLAASLGFSLHTDFCVFIFFPFVALVWLIFKLPVKSKWALKGLMLFFLFQLPMLFFDTRHNFLMTKGLLNFLFSSNKGININSDKIIEPIKLFFITFARVIYPGDVYNLAWEKSFCHFKNFLGYNSSFWAVVFAAVSLFFLFYQWRKNKNNIGIKLLGLFIIIFNFSLLIFNFLGADYLHEFYFYPVLTSFILTIALFLDFLWQKVNRYLAILLILFLIFINLKAVLKMQHSYGLSVKQKAVQWVISQIGDRSFSLESFGLCHPFGFRYLFDIYGKPPLVSDVDRYFHWLYKTSRDEKSELKVIFFTPGPQKDPEYEEKKKFYYNKSIKSQKFQDMEVLILEERTND